MRAEKFEEQRKKKELDALEEQKILLQHQLEEITKKLSHLERDFEKELQEEFSEFDDELQKIYDSEQEDKQNIQNAEINKQHFFDELDKRRKNKTSIQQLKNQITNYDIDALIDKYINMVSIDPEGTSFYLRDLNNTLNTLEFIYITGRWNYTQYMRINNILWHLETFETLSLSSNVFNEINELFKNTRHNQKDFSFVIQYYLDDIIQLVANDSSLDRLLHYINQHNNLLSLVDPSKINSLNLNKFIANKLLSGENEDDIETQLFDIIEQVGGKKINYKSKYIKYKSKKN